MPSVESVDVVVIGAGLSGIDAGVHLSRDCPDLSYVILEGRAQLGGTWDLFKYPGVRFDSDVFTMGYSFKPWLGDKMLADGPAFLTYLNETAREYGVDKHIRYNSRVVRAEWSSASASWTVHIDKTVVLGQSAEHTNNTSRTSTAKNGTTTVERVHIQCNFLVCCSGYYRYDRGHSPDFPGINNFKGKVVHPQFWEPSLDYSGQRVVVIGSGATAVTLVPTLAAKAAHVTMLQRSPTYIVSRPARDPFALWLFSWLPVAWAYAFNRWRSVLSFMLFYMLSRTFPNLVKNYLLKGIGSFFGNNEAILAHFRPLYNPWDQRVCLIPDGDLFCALRDGRASVVTDTIDTFTAAGIRLKSGEEISADIVVTATGLKLQAFGGIEMVVDGVKVDVRQHVVYRGAMISDIPNMAFVYGYVNASWTLKADLACEYICRLLRTMRAEAVRTVVPRVLPGEVLSLAPIVTTMTSGYFLRGVHLFPKQASTGPWQFHQNYLLDLKALHFDDVHDKHLDMI